MRWLLIVCLCGLTACSREPLVQSQSYVFGTLVDISIYGEPEPHAHELINHVLQDFQGLHNRLHAWQQGSELYTLNAAFAKGEQSIQISNELAGIIQDTTRLSQQSQGTFNPAIGHLISTWGFQRDEFSPVSVEPAQIQALLNAQPQMTDIVIKNDSAYSKNAAVKLDLGGYAKGYALDRAAGYLRAQGVKSALINIGGNIIAIGQHGEKPWRVGIQHPRKAGPIAALDLPDGWAIGTSGDYQRYFELDGKRYCHIINPYTGYPAQGTQSVTILVAPGEHAGTLSDVASKPIFIALADERGKAAQLMGIHNLLVIDSAGKTFVSQAMQKRLQWVEPNQQVQILKLE
jgi:FAD:protein FMN transferase